MADPNKDSKGKGLALPSHSNSPLHQPDNAPIFLPPQQAGRTLPAPNRRRLRLIPFKIGQTMINADIDTRIPGNCIGEKEARRRNLSSLPSLVPGLAKTIKGKIECSSVIFLLSISGHTSQGGFWTYTGQIPIHVIPAGYGEVPLTIGKKTLYILRQEQPEFNMFYHMKLGSSVAPRTTRDLRSAPPRRHPRQLYRNEGSPSYVSPGAMNQSHYQSDPSTLISGSLPALPQNYSPLATQTHWHHSPAVPPSQTPMGLPDLRLASSTQAPFFPISADDFTNMSFPEGNTSGTFAGNASGSTPWGSQGMPGPAEDFNYGGYPRPSPSGPSGSGPNPPF